MSVERDDAFRVGQQVAAQINAGIERFLDAEVAPRFEEIVDAFRDGVADIKVDHSVEDWDEPSRHLMGVFQDELAKTAQHCVSLAPTFLEEEYALAEIADLRGSIDQAVRQRIEGLTTTLLARAAANYILPMTDAARNARRKLNARKQLFGIVWPPRLDGIPPGMAGRAGRVLHWIGAGAGWLWAAGGALVGVFNAKGDPEIAFGLGLTLVIVGLASALVGRGLRYILASE